MTPDEIKKFTLAHYDFTGSRKLTGQQAAVLSAAI